MPALSTWNSKQLTTVILFTLLMIFQLYNLVHIPQLFYS